MKHGGQQQDLIIRPSVCLCAMCLPVACLCEISVQWNKEYSVRITFVSCSVSEDKRVPCHSKNETTSLVSPSSNFLQTVERNELTFYSAAWSWLTPCIPDCSVTDLSARLPFFLLSVVHRIKHLLCCYSRKKRPGRRGGPLIQSFNPCDCQYGSLVVSDVEVTETTIYFLMIQML